MPRLRPIRLGPFAALLLLACGSKPEAVDLSPKSISMSRRGESQNITAVALNEKNEPIANTEFDWLSADPKIATVDGQGKVTAVSTGTTTVSAAVKGSDIKNQIVVSAVLPASIEADPATVTLRGSGIQQDVLLRISDDKGALIAGLRADWVSDNPAVATVANGTIMAVADGTCTITATASDASVRIPVQVKGPIATTVTIDPNRVVVKVGGTEQLGAIVIDDIGAGMPDAVPVWSSSDPSIASVNESGLVTGVRRGNTWINAVVGTAAGQIPVGVR